MRKITLSLALALFSSAYAENAINAQDICQYGTPEGTPANLIFTLDYSGSMSNRAYLEDSYNPSKIYLGYFDPFGIYRLVQLNTTTYVWEKNSQEPEVYLKPLLWSKGFDEEENLYSGNYLNYIYTTRLSLLQVLLTGGLYKQIQVNTGTGCELDIWFGDSVKNKIHNPHLKLYLEALLNGTEKIPFGSIEDNGTDIVIKVPIPCLLEPPLNMAITNYHIARNFGRHFYKHWQHAVCRVLPTPMLRHLCKKADNLDAKVVSAGTTQTLYVIPLLEEKQSSSLYFYGWVGKHCCKHKGVNGIRIKMQKWLSIWQTHKNAMCKLMSFHWYHHCPLYNLMCTGYTHKNFYLKMEDAFTFDGTSLKGLLQRLEERVDRPRVGGILFSDKIKAAEDLSYFYDELISDINTTPPEGATYTGETFEVVKTFFENKTVSNPYKFSVEESNGNLVTLTVSNAKNWNALFSDGEWNGKIDPAAVAYQMWRGGYADLVSSLPGNQTVETYSFAMFLNTNDYGYRAMENIAVMGGFIDKDGNKIPKGYEDYINPDGSFKAKCLEYDFGTGKCVRWQPLFNSELVNPPIKADTIGEWYINGKIKNFFGSEKITKIYFNTYNLFATKIANKLESVYCGEEPSLVPISKQPVELIKEISSNIWILKNNRVGDEQIKDLLATALAEIALSQTGEIRESLANQLETIETSTSIDEAVTQAQNLVREVIREQVRIVEENPTAENLSALAVSLTNIAPIEPTAQKQAQIVSNFAQQLQQGNISITQLKQQLVNTFEDLEITDTLEEAQKLEELVNTVLDTINNNQQLSEEEVQNLITSLQNYINRLTSLSNRVPSLRHIVNTLQQLTNNIAQNGITQSTLKKIENALQKSQQTLKNYLLKKNIVFWMEY